MRSSRVKFEMEGEWKYRDKGVKIGRMKDRGKGRESQRARVTKMRDFYCFIITGSVPVTVSRCPFPR